MKPQTLATSPAHRAQALSSSASSSIDTDSEWFDEPEHWDAVARDVKQEFRSVRLKAFEEINLVIFKSMYSNESFSSEELHDARQMGRRLLEAQHHGHWEALQREFTSFVSGTLKKLQKPQGGASHNTASFAGYGGVVGNAIFRTISADVVVPVLTSFLKKFSDQTRDLKYEDKLDATKVMLHSFLVLAGKDRGMIAEMTATPEFEKFGRLNTGVKRIVDCVCSWNPWNTMMIDKIGEIISPAWEEFRASNKDGVDPQMFLPRRKQLLLRNENASLRLGGENGERKGWLFDSTKSTDEKTCFTFEWSLEKDANKAIRNPIAVTEIMCWHPAPIWRRAEVVLAPDFLEALGWTHDPQQLQDKLASIFYDMSDTSTFDRGGASISEMMIKAIAALHGYALEFSPDWTPPDHPQPDQQALSEFDRDKFIQAARKHILLRKIDQGAL